MGPRGTGVPHAPEAVLVLRFAKRLHRARARQTVSARADGHFQALPDGGKGGPRAVSGALGGRKREHLDLRDPYRDGRRETRDRDVKGPFQREGLLPRVHDQARVRPQK